MPALSRPARALLTGVLLTVSAFVVVGSRAPSASAVAPGQNGVIAFHRFGSGLGQLFSVSPDGSNETPLGNLHGGFPSFFAGGSKLGHIDGGVHVADADGSNDHVVPGTEPGFYFSVSPDGTHFASQANDASSTAKIRVSNFDGSDPQFLLPNSGTAEWGPSWSPSSDKIAYVTFRPNDPELWIVGADGSNPHLVVLAPSASIRPPGFSPDGTKLVFGSNPYTNGGTTPQAHLQTVGVDGVGLQEIPVTLPAGRVSTTSFSPDGKRIVFAMSGEAQGIYTVAVNGTNLQRLTSGEDDGADWQPITAASMPTTTTSTTVAPTTTTSTTIANQPPIALGSLSWPTPRRVYANAARSSDPDGTIVSYVWRWGDYTNPSPTKTASHTYAKAGDYYLRLTVTDNKGAVTTRALWIRVS